MDANSATVRAVGFSVLLHVGIVAFLALAMLNCASWEAVFTFLHLPPSLNPVTCTKPIQLAGQVIEATLVGSPAAPTPKHSRHARAATPPPQTRELPKLEVPKPAPVKVLPPPPLHPDIKDQEKIAQLAQEQAEQAQKAQEEKEKQRQAELAREQEADRILKQLDEVKAQRQAEEKKIKLAQQRAQQLADLKNAQDKADNQDAPAAAEARTGEAGQDNNAYVAALQNAITQNWLRPDNIPPGVVCPIHIVQIPGGQVISAKVLPSCPFDDVGRHSVEAAVLRAQPLPYQGFEKVFQRDITFNFKVEN